MKIAIASSGLGHVARGIETWACDTAVALAELSVNSYSLSGVGKPNNQEPITRNDASGGPLSITLFSGAPLDAVSVTQASSLCSCPCTTGRMPVSPHLTFVTLPCLKRGDWLTRLMAWSAPGFAWRWGWKSTYDIEQRSFWCHLWPILRDERYDILHVQDPLLADLCHRYREAGKLQTKEILAHGTEETPEFLARFPHVQHLAPWHLEQMGEGKPAIESRIQKSEVRIQKAGDVTTDEHGCTRIGRKWVAIPNFVDCDVFAPVGGGKVDEASRLVSLNEQKAIRQRMGIPPDAFVIGCVAAVKKHHKRVDYLIREFACFCKAAKSTKEHNIPSRSSRASVQNSSPESYLLIAGARTDESAELLALAESLIPGRYKILTNVGRDRMPELYRAMDVFVLTSLFEMMPIALLEALASGLPCAVNRHPVLEWMVGAEGAGQLSGGGELSSCSVAQLLSKRPEGSLPSATQQPSNSTTGRVSPAAQQPNPSTCSGQANSATCPASSGGISIDMSREGVLAAALAGLTPDWIAEHGRQARDRAERMFSKQAVIGQYVAYYREVMGGDRPVGRSVHG